MGRRRYVTFLEKTPMSCRTSDACARSVFLIDSVFPGFVCYLITTAVVVFGAVFGLDLLEVPAHIRVKAPSLVQALCNGDGRHFIEICERGYSFSPSKRSTVAFFPAYPVVAMLLMQITGAPASVALIVVTHCLFAVSMVLMHYYVRLRLPDGPPAVATWTIAMLGTFPTTCFFRFAYSEALLLLLLVTFFVGMRLNAPLLALAATSGAATATRHLGLVLVAPMLLHIWHRSNSAAQFCRRGVLLLPIAISGLLAYIAYQAIQFSEPFAFALAQQHWELRDQVQSPFAVLSGYLTLRPLRDVYDVSAVSYWRYREMHGCAVFSLYFANPPFLVFAVAVLAIGYRCKWATLDECLVALVLVLVPFVLKGHVNGMAGTGRFVAVAFPMFIVLGRIMNSAPQSVAASWIALCALYLFAYSALFAASYPIV
jgi:hypothetical protein